MVISWIIDNIDGDIVNQFLDFPTARDLWKGIETLYSSGRDGLQIYDLSVKASTLKQGTDSIEALNYTVLMSSTGCLVQDTQTGKIIGRGTEHGG